MNQFPDTVESDVLRDASHAEKLPDGGARPGDALDDLAAVGVLHAHLDEVTGGHGGRGGEAAGEQGHDGIAVGVDFYVIDLTASALQALAQLALM